MEAGIATLSSPQVAELRNQEVKTSIRKNSRSQTGTFVTKQTHGSFSNNNSTGLGFGFKERKKKTMRFRYRYKNRSQYPSAKGEEKRTIHINLHFWGKDIQPSGLEFWVKCWTENAGKVDR